MKILLTTTSFADTPGKHHDVLTRSQFDVVTVRGPLSEADLLELLQRHGGFDALLCGDDQITAKVMDAALPRLRVISKYGIGLDSIDVAAATARKIPVLFTPGVNETTVAEHTIMLMIGVAKNLWVHASAFKAGQWKRQTGKELFDKHLGLVGSGRIAREVARRARAMGMHIVSFGRFWPPELLQEFQIRLCESIEELLPLCDVVSLHTNLTPETQGMINAHRIAMMRDGAILVNTGRGGLIVEQDVADACRSGKLFGYGADTLAHEPMKAPHLFQTIDNILLTPHVGSRTFESVQRQGLRAANNTVNFLTGNHDYIQANKF